MSASLSGARVVVTGRRPTNSGIMPNLMRSSGVTWARVSRARASPASSRPVAPPARAEPEALLADALADDLLEPDEGAAADEEDVRGVDLDVCCSGCLRPPGAGRSRRPSSILEEGCWTPSPETSRVIETFMNVLPILSISSM